MKDKDTKTKTLRLCTVSGTGHFVPPLHSDKTLKKKSCEIKTPDRCQTDRRWLCVQVAQCNDFINYIERVQKPLWPFEC